MSDPELADLLFRDLGDDLDLSLEDFQEAVALLHDDPIFQAARRLDAAARLCVRARDLRCHAQRLRVNGSVRRLLGRWSPTSRHPG